MIPTRSNLLATLALCALAACGGDAEAPPSAEVDTPPVEQTPREPLAEADLVGLDIANLSIEVPWTQNAINRGTDPVAPRSMIESVEVSEHEGFDRMIFTFSSDAPAPGYQIRRVPPTYAVVCGDQDEGGEGATDEETEAGEEAGHEEGAEPEHAPELEGNSFLVLRIDPARIQEGGRRTMSIGSEAFEFSRIHEAGVTCDADDVVTWIAGLREGSEVRVLEMRSPQRLVVDVR